MKTLAIRLEDELHAQLSVVAQLEEQTVTDAIRGAILAYIEERKTQLADRAEAALAEIERDAASRREAIAALFGSEAAGAEGTGEELSPRHHRGKGGGSATS